MHPIQTYFFDFKPCLDWAGSRHQDKCAIAWWDWGLQQDECEKSKQCLALLAHSHSTCCPLPKINQDQCLDFHIYPHADFPGDHVEHTLIVMDSFHCQQESNFFSWNGIFAHKTRGVRVYMERPAAVIIPHMRAQETKALILRVQDWYRLTHRDPRHHGCQFADLLKFIFLYKIVVIWFKFHRSCSSWSN